MKDFDSWGVKLVQALLDGLKPSVLPRLTDPDGKSIGRVLISTPMAESAIAEYLTKLEKNLRMFALTRGAALLGGAALVLTVLLVFIVNGYSFSNPSVFWARVAHPVATVSHIWGTRTLTFTIGWIAVLVHLWVVLTA